MKRLILILAALVLASFAAPTAPGQTAQKKRAARNATRDRLRLLLDNAARHKEINVFFGQRTNQPYTFVATISDGLKHADSLDILLSVNNNETISLRVFPSLKGNYINIERARNSGGLLRKLVNLNEHNFLFWGADDEGDIFSGYTFTLESGFPAEAIQVVLISIRNTDEFVGELRPFIDGPTR